MAGRVYGTLSSVMSDQTLNVCEPPPAGGIGAPCPRRVAQGLIMGIDFGTAVTKIAIRATANEALSLQSDYVCAADFGEVSELSPSCLLQTALWTDGNIAALEKRDGCHRSTDMKIRLMRGESDARGMAETVAYLAAAIRRAQARFADDNSGWLKDTNKEWRYNFGIPADLENKNQQPMRDNYHRAASAAAVLAESSAPIGIEPAYAAIVSKRSCDKIAFVPEVVAQAVGYVRAQGAIEGINVMVDVGAWTLDVCALILLDVREGDKARFHVHAAKVRELGCIPLHQKRAAAVKRAVDFNPSRPLPPPKAYADESGREIGRVEAIDAGFGRECADCAQWVLGEMKRLNPTDRFWQERIAFIVCGGGCYADPFKGVSRQTWKRFARAANAEAIHITVKKPQDLDADGIDDDNYHRLSVAWGLSHPDIHHTLPSGEVARVRGGRDIPRPTFDDRGKEPWPSVS